jgi:hypothetical protein
MKNTVFWDIKTHFIPHRKHYVFDTEPSRLMLCKIWGFDGGVTMKNAVYRDIKTHFVLLRKHIMSPLQSPAG